MHVCASLYASIPKNMKKKLYIQYYRHYMTANSVTSNSMTANCMTFGTANCMTTTSWHVRRNDDKPIIRNTSFNLLFSSAPILNYST